MSGAGAPLSRFGALWFCYFAAIGAYNPYAPLWFKDLGFSTLAIGSLAAMLSWTRVFAPYGWGWLGDHSGQRVRLIRLGALVSVVAASGLLVARDYALVALCAVLLFLANGAVVPLSEATLARHLQADSSSASGMDSDRYGGMGGGRYGGMDSGRYGRVRLWGSVGFIVSVTLFGLLFQFAGISWFPVLVVAMYAALWLVTLRLPAARDDVSGQEQAPPVLAVLRRPEVAWFFGSIFFTVLAHTSLYAFFSLYLDQLGYAKSAVGLLWAVSVAAEIAFFWAQGHYFGRLEPHRWLQWAAALSVLRFAATAAFGASPVALVLAQSLHAITFAAQHVACIVLIHRHFPGPLRGRGQALYTTLGYGIPGVLGGLGGGWLSTRIDFAAVFWAAAVAAVLGWACARAAERAARALPA